ncbi:MAG: hypothetical protein D6688_03765 [Alphaproteobacteria bacterium]|nr:MAG: hypothetical protein D6688_03765 [Alphaproteobacteria bacterium]
MTTLVAGLALWWGGHLFRRFLPGLRAALGGAGKGVAALVILAGVVLMVLGYRASDGAELYALPAWARHVNNLLMLVAVLLLGLGQSKSRFRGALRHPMLTGVLVWSVAHLLVNADPASLVLFGGLGAWSLTEMAIINRAEPEWRRPEGGTLAGDARLLVIGVVLYALIGVVHGYLGPSPFPG